MMADVMDDGMNLLDGISGPQIVVSGEVDTSERTSQLEDQRESKQKHGYSRKNVCIDEYIKKDPKYITAKQLRVLIPAMFHKLCYPDTDIRKTKIKGLWNPKNKPRDFPDDVEFRDPNNASKMAKAQMDKLFVYLKWKLTERDSQKGFDVLNENSYMNQAFSTEQLTEIEPMDASESEEVPNTLLSSGAIQEPVQVVAPITDQSIVSYGVQPASCSVQQDACNQVIEVDDTEQLFAPQNYECEQFATEVYSSLEQPQNEFFKAFQKHPVVLKTISLIREELLAPLFSLARCGDKEKCLELSRCCAHLLDILKRYVFLGPQYDPTEELNTFFCDLPKQCVESDVTASALPEVDSLQAKEDMEFEDNEEVGQQFLGIALTGNLAQDENHPSFPLDGSKAINIGETTIQQPTKEFYQNQCGSMMLNSPPISSDPNKLTEKDIIEDVLAMELEYNHSCSATAASSVKQAAISPEPPDCRQQSSLGSAIPLTVCELAAVSDDGMKKPKQRRASNRTRYKASHKEVGQSVPRKFYKQK